MCSGKGGEEAAEIIQVSAFFQLEVEVPFGQVEVGEPVLIHEFDDSTDFLEFHVIRRFEFGWMTEHTQRVLPAVARSRG